MASPTLSETPSDSAAVAADSPTESQQTTGVLHDVANLLSTVKVSAGLVKRSIATRCADGIDQLGEVDTRGLRSIFSAIDRERGRANRELDALIEKIDHIASLISLQQTDAKTQVARERNEEIAVATLIHEAQRVAETNAMVRLSSAKLGVVTDPHRVIPILVNLLRNAQEAIDAAGTKQPLIRIAVEEVGAGVEICVMDNGGGLDEDAAAKVFDYGYTTKVKGHGFGLFHAFHTADDLGGSLSLALESNEASDAPGACFRLWLPMAPSPVCST